MEVYERIIDKIIKIHKDSLKEIFAVIKSLNLFSDAFLEKIKYKFICKHLLTFKILLGINAYTQIHFNKDEMMQLIKESTNFIK